MKKIFFVLAILIAGCAANKTVRLSRPFDGEHARSQLQDGPNTINGSALIRQAGGGIVTCAGNPVYLMPVTDTAKEWASHVYGSWNAGFRNAATQGVMFKNADEFMATVRTSICDPNGSFKFEHVANGEFFVFTRIVWHVGGEIQGGSVMRAVKVDGTSNPTIVLSPYGS